MDDRIYSDILSESPFLKPAVGRFIERLRNSLEEMAEALRKGRLEEVGTIAHRIKGAGGTHGFPVVSETALRLERSAREGNLRESEEFLRELHSLAARLTPDPPATSG